MYSTLLTEVERARVYVQQIFYMARFTWFSDLDVSCYNNTFPIFTLSNLLAFEQVSLMQLVLFEERTFK